MNNNPWNKIEDVPPKFREELEWWHEYDCCVYCGEAHCYDGRYVNVGGRHWHQAIPLSDFTHWRLPGVDPTETEGGE